MVRNVNNADSFCDVVPTASKAPVVSSFLGAKLAITWIQFGRSSWVGAGRREGKQIIEGSVHLQSLRYARRHSYRQKLGRDLRHEFPVRIIH